jgi:hypothetical protein
MSVCHVKIVSSCHMVSALNPKKEALSMGSMVKVKGPQTSNK